MAVRVRLQGINILVQALDDYSKEVKNLVYDETREWAERTENAAQRDVPVDTGNLKSTIRTESENNGLTWIVKAGGINNVDYAPYIEFGTGARVNQSFLEEYGLSAYAMQFTGEQEPFVALPERSYLFRNARTEFEKTLENIKKILEQT
jgi:HK97 gp10 family phage protein